jgi:hypothetical protein
MEVLIVGALDQAGREALALQGSSDCAGFALSSIIGASEQLGGGVSLNDAVEVHKPELGFSWFRVREHAQGPGVSLSEMPESQEPEAGRQVPHCWPCSIGKAPVEVRAPQRDPDVAASGKHSAELSLECLREAESGSCDPGELGSVAVEIAPLGLNHAT